MVLRRGQFRHRVIAECGDGNRDGSVSGRCKRAEHVTAGIDHLKDRASQRVVCPNLVLVDDKGSGAGFGCLARRRRRRIMGRRRVILVSRIAADRAGRDRGLRVGVQHIVLEIPVLVSFQRLGVEDFIVLHVGAHHELAGSGFALNGALGINHLHLNRIAGVLCTVLSEQNLADFLPVHVGDLGPFRRAFIQRELHGRNRPGFAFDGEHLLVDFFAVDRGGVGGRLVRRGGQLRADNRSPLHAAGVDVFRRGQDALRRLFIRTGQVRVDAHAADRPVAEQIAPQRHLRRVIRLIAVL